MSDGFDWNDPEAVRRLMTGLQTHLADMHAVVKDMMRPVRKRQLGLREHKRIYRDARKGVIEAIERAMPQSTSSPPAGR
jgi:hypothetical protein